jgi:glycine cleavage system H protein
VHVTEQLWRGCLVPPELLYDVERHVWVRLEGDEAVLGMTDVAQTMGGKVVSVTWKPAGKKVKRGRPLAVIESAKWVGPFPTPLTCEIVETNEAAFERDILIANRDPYGEGWLVRVRPSAPDLEVGDLLDGPAAFERYKGFIELEDITCFRCAD